MVKFYGHVGYAEIVETAPGVHQEQFVEYPYYGDLKQDLRKLATSENLNDDIVLQNILELVGDQYAYEHYFAMRYVRFNTVCWKVGYVEVRYPRLLIRFGGVYGGQTADPVADATGSHSGKP